MCQGCSFLLRKRGTCHRVGLLPVNMVKYKQTHEEKSHEHVYFEYMGENLSLPLCIGSSWHGHKAEQRCHCDQPLKQWIGLSCHPVRTENILDYDALNCRLS